MSPRASRSMCMTNASPTRCNGLGSGADISIPELSIATWPSGSVMTCQIASADAWICRLADSRSSDIKPSFVTSTSRSDAGGQSGFDGCGFGVARGETAVKPAGEPPVRSTGKLHDRGHEDRADEHRVEEHGDSEAEAEEFDDPLPAE